MNREFKVALILLVSLLAVSTVLLEVLAGIHFWSFGFLGGFVPFALLLAPYILFSTNACLRFMRDWLAPSLWRKLAVPLYIAAVYGVFSAMGSNFNGPLLGKLLFWLLIPTLVFTVGFSKANPFYLKEFAVALMLWLPLEFGKLSGFDIIFREGFQIPAQPFIAPVFGLYLFAILRDLPDIGYTFKWRSKDLQKVGIVLPLLALLLIPLGTRLGFIGYSFFDTSFADMVKYLIGIYFLVAIPEELLFRGIIQNLLGKVLAHWRFGTAAALGIASVIFGFSHWNNFNPTDWRYVFLATIAGLGYGWVYNRTGKTTVSALVHCGVNFVWAVIFGG